MLREIVDPNEQITLVDVKDFCERNSLTLPTEYELFLLQTNGGQPIPASFQIEGFGNNPIGKLQAFFGLKARIATEDLEFLLAEFGDKIPHGILPIGCTGSGDFVCLDLRDERARVVFWDFRQFWGNNCWSEADIYPVANNFAELIRALADCPGEQESS